VTIVPVSPATTIRTPMPVSEVNVSSAALRLVSPVGKESYVTSESVTPAFGVDAFAEAVVELADESVDESSEPQPATIAAATTPATAVRITVMTSVPGPRR
jgi:hypothetical protein